MKRTSRIFCGMLAILLLALCACNKAEPTEPPIYYATAPIPDGNIEEDSILRNPSKVDDPENHAPLTEELTQNETVTSEPAVTEVPTPTETRLSFVAFGDNVIHGAIMEDGKRHAGEGEEYDFTYIYDNVRDVIEAADIAYINQETPMGGKTLGYTGYPYFNGPQEMGDALIEIGYDIVCIGTNHLADYSDKGMIGTLDYWDKQPVTYIGGYRNQEDYDNIRIHEVDGVKIALLSYTFTNEKNIYGGKGVSKGSELVIPYFNEADIRRQTAKAKELADLVFVNMHWGNENFTLTAQQKQYAQILAECEVDVVIGQHPHVLQPIEWVETESGHKMLLSYSTGNFVSTMLYDYFMVGGMLSFDIVKTVDDIYIENVVLEPTVTHYDMNRENISVYFMRDYTEELANAHGCNLNAKTSLAKMKSYVTDNIDAAFLPEYMKN